MGSAMSAAGASFGMFRGPGVGVLTSGLCCGAVVGGCVLAFAGDDAVGSVVGVLAADEDSVGASLGFCGDDGAGCGAETLGLVGEAVLDGTEDFVIAAGTKSGIGRSGGRVGVGSDPRLAFTTGGDAGGGGEGGW
jgi:hypothetical protein